MRNFSILLIAAALAGSAAQADTAVRELNTEMQQNYNWFPKGGERIAFDVFRNGNRFGSHTVNFERLDTDMIQVTNEIDLKVKLAFITAYKYSHRSTEVWKDQQLIELSGKTQKEGDKLRLEAERAGEVLKVDGTLFDGERPLGTYPSSHWNIYQIFQDAIMSTESGEELDIDVENLGEDVLTIGDKQISAQHFRMKSKLDVDLWYDDQGRWVKCAFSARGQEIEYRLRELY